MMVYHSFHIMIFTSCGTKTNKKKNQANFDLHTSLVLWRFYGYFYYGIQTLQNSISEKSCVDVSTLSECLYV